MADKFLAVDLCCNDEITGCFRGCFDGIEISNSAGNEITGDCLMFEGDGPSLTWTPISVVVGRTSYPMRNRRSGRGNWCWDGCSMTVGDVKSLLHQLKRAGWWFEDCDEFPELQDMLRELTEAESTEERKARGDG